MLLIFQPLLTFLGYVLLVEGKWRIKIGGDFGNKTYLIFQITRWIFCIKIVLNVCPILRIRLVSLDFKIDFYITNDL